ncbi:MAG: flavin reductase family protein [Hyphomicrobiales bacterium]|nr:flavin reductase family protein [Hyphomicrobiales bacterium]
MTISSDVFRDALGRYPTGVCIVTGIGSAGEPVGVTIGSFSSLSLTPPLVLFSIDVKSSNLEAYTEGNVFSVNVLSEKQAEISDVFAFHRDGRFAHGVWRTGENGCALLDGCVFHLQCDRTQTFEGGDHLIVVGYVRQIDVGTEEKPLIYFRGMYHELSVGA